MAKKRKYKPDDFDETIGSEPYIEWTEEELNFVKAFAKEHHAKRTPEHIMLNALTGVKCEMREYLDDETTTKRTRRSLEYFLNLFLDATNLTLKKFATLIGTTDANLKKYLNGQRTFSVDLAMKFANFFHTTPDLWLKVRLKNELIELRANRNMIRDYKIYDYKPTVYTLVKEEKILYERKQKMRSRKKKK